MARVSVTVNGRRYDIACDDGQEAHVFRLAQEVDRKAGQLVASLGHVGEALLLLLVSLLLADELAEARAGLHRWRERAEAAGAEAGTAAEEAGAAADDALGDELLSLARRIETVARELNPVQTIAATAEPS